MVTMKVKIIFSLVFILQSCNVISFVKQLLKKPPVINNNDIWSKSIPNIAIYGNMTLSLRRTLNVPTPSYVQVLVDRVLSVTSFSLFRKGSIMQFDLTNTSKLQTLRGDYLWPNELTMFRDKQGHSLMLIPDGFLLPGQSDGGLYIIRDPHLPHTQPIRITSSKKGWFYHRATYIKLPGGKEGIITARAKKTIFGNGEGELVWLSIPAAISNSDVICDEPWQEVVLAKGPDVMFEVLDIDKNDNSIEIVSAHFFGSKLSVSSLSATTTFPFVNISHTLSLDIVGRPYGLCLASMAPGSSGMEAGEDREPERDLEHFPHTMPSISSRGYRDTTSFRNSRLSTSSSASSSSSSPSTPPPPPYPRNSLLPPPTCTCDNTYPSHILVSTHECNYDILSGFKMLFETIGGKYPRVRTGGVSVRSGDKTSVESGLLAASADRGGGLYAYEIPKPRLAKTASTKTTTTIARQQQQPQQQTILETISTRNSLLENIQIQKPQPTSTSSLISPKIVHNNNNKIEVPIINQKWRHGLSASAVELPVTTTVPNPTSKDERQPLLDSTATSSTSMSVSISPRSSSSSSSSSTVSSTVPSWSWSDSDWKRHTLFRGFKVRGWGGIFSPGAPGFPYVFRMPSKPQSPPLILLAGDCTGSAYVFAPIPSTGPSTSSTSTPFSVNKDTVVGNKDRESGNHEIEDEDDDNHQPPGSYLPTYQLAFEVECGATVGSAAASAPHDRSGDVEIFIPSYELNQVHVFRLSDRGDDG